MTKLNQLLAIEKGARSNADQALSKADRALSKEERTAGIARTYQPNAEDGDQYPPENKRVEVKVEEVIASLAPSFTKLYDVTLQKELANQLANANVVVNGETVLANVPVTYLLFLEKKLVDLRTFVARLPELNASDKWDWDDAQDVWATPTYGTKSSKKILRNHTKWAPPDPSYKQEAQVETFTEDVFVGVWNTRKFSGAISPARKKQLLSRVDALTDAVKVAREEANTLEVQNAEAGQQIFDHLFTYLPGT